jgi:putative transposase
MSICRLPNRSSDSLRQERGIWQRGFWEHTIQDVHDFSRHFDDIHDNAVKHGWASSPAEWPHSSFHRWVERAVYDKHCGRSELRFDDLDETAME